MNASSTSGPAQPAEGSTDSRTAATDPPADGGRDSTQSDHPDVRRLTSASVAALRRVMPLIQAYARIEAGTGTQPGRFAPLTTGEEAVLAAAGKRAAGETLAYASVTYPVAGNEPYVAAERPGEFRPPNIRHLRSLFAAAQKYLGDDDTDQDEQPEPQVPEDRRVAYLAVAPGEYQLVEGPVTPTQSRRSAMRQRAFDPPPPATLVQSQQRYELAPAASAGQPAMMSGGRQAARAAYGAHAAQRGQMVYSACACCGGSHPRWNFPPASRDEAGKCKSVFSISCETQWRLRECFKVAFCELLRCLGDELCDDGTFAPKQERDFGRCLEGFACTLIACLPEAICPTVNQEICVMPIDALSCDCNFAVGE